MGAESRQSVVHRFFAGLAEYTFQARLGVADPPLIDYLSALMTRFVHADDIFRLRDLAGRQLQQVTHMLGEADARVGDARREAHRHVGDFTLFWTGLYPEALKKLCAADAPDHLLDYNEHGKRAYYIASTIPTERQGADNEVLRRLSYEFELCQYGLQEVRREWERRDEEGDGPANLLIN
jgi:hypothetical protein